MFTIYIKGGLALAWSIRHETSHVTETVRYCEGQVHNWISFTTDRIAIILLTTHSQVEYLEVSQDRWLKGLTLVQCRWQTIWHNRRLRALRREEWRGHVFAFLCVHSVSQQFPLITYGIGMWDVRIWKKKYVDEAMYCGVNKLFFVCVDIYSCLGTTSRWRPLHFCERVLILLAIISDHSLVMSNLFLIS